jgi:hypothetical protein
MPKPSCRPLSKSLFCAVILAALPASLFSQEEASFVEYARSNYPLTISFVTKEIKAEMNDSIRFISRLRLATNSFAQCSSIQLNEILQVYEAARHNADKFHYGERLKTEEREVLFWLKEEKNMKADAILEEVEKVVKWPEESISELTLKSSRFFALALLARRKCLAPDADVEWFFLAGKAIEEDTGSGDIFFEHYLENTQGSNAPHRMEAIKYCEQIYKQRNNGKLSAFHAQKIKHWKKTTIVKK